MIHHIHRSLIFLLLISSLESVAASENGNTNGIENSKEIMEERVMELSERMKPTSLILPGFHFDKDKSVYKQTNDPDSRSSAVPTQQFFHLHHMKSGGTSLSSFLRCGLSRMRKLYGHDIPTADLSECSNVSYYRCLENPEDRCHKRIDEAATMNFCAPLAVTDHFGWSQAQAVTMMRHPVDRVWSMYRFRTSSCFKCNTLKQVYEDMDTNNTTSYGSGVCLTQLTDHVTRNLLSTIDVAHLDDDNLLTRQQMLDDAIHGIQNRFTVVGIIEQLDETIEQFVHSFPWLTENISGSDVSCTFPHSNASPRSNHCGPDRTHWDLPAHPDDETRKIIEEHNQLDIQVYEAALEQFELQKLAMRLSDEEDFE